MDEVLGLNIRRFKKKVIRFVAICCKRKKDFVPNMLGWLHQVFSPFNCIKVHLLSQQFTISSFFSLPLALNLCLINSTPGSGHYLLLKWILVCHSLCWELSYLGSSGNMYAVWCLLDTIVWFDLCYYLLIDDARNYFLHYYSLKILVAFFFFYMGNLCPWWLYFDGYWCV